MWICEHCGEKFEEPEYVEFCYEDEYGVSSMFSTHNYGEYAICPECGSEDIERYYGDDDEEYEEE